MGKAGPICPLSLLCHLTRHSRPRVASPLLPGPPEAAILLFCYLPGRVVWEEHWTKSQEIWLRPGTQLSRLCRFFPVSPCGHNPVGIIHCAVERPTKVALEDVGWRHHGLCCPHRSRLAGRSSWREGSRIEGASVQTPAGALSLPILFLPKKEYKVSPQMVRGFTHRSRGEGAAPFISVVPSPSVPETEPSILL